MTKMHILVGEQLAYNEMLHWQFAQLRGGNELLLKADFERCVKEFATMLGDTDNVKALGHKDGKVYFVTYDEVTHYYEPKKQIIPFAEKMKQLLQ